MKHRKTSQIIDAWIAAARGEFDVLGLRRRVTENDDDETRSTKCTRRWHSEHRS